MCPHDCATGGHPERVYFKPMWLTLIAAVMALILAGSLAQPLRAQDDAQKDAHPVYLSLIETVSAPPLDA